jgi:putative phage-type endonuclease
MSKKDKTGMSHEQWVEARRSFIGGSDAGVVAGVNPYKSWLELYYDKLGELTIETTFPMRLGSHTEAFILNEYRYMTGLDVRSDNYIWRDDERPHMGCNLDGLIVHSDTDMEIVEIKHTGYNSEFGAEGTDEVPEYYNMQVQHCLYVTGLNRGRIVHVAGNRPPKEYIINRNDALLKDYVELCDQFWAHVRDGIPPEPETHDDVKRLYREDNGKHIDATDRVMGMVERLAKVKGDIKGLLELQESLELAVKEYMGHNQVLSYEGGVIATWKTSTRSSLDTKRLKADNPAVYSKYTVENTMRRFNLK